MLIIILDIAGIIAFAITGALVGIEKRMDSFGIVVLSVVTAVGGGVLRDILLGHLPPDSLVHPRNCIISIVIALVVFVLHRRLEHFRNVIQFFDAIGLGAFTAIGSAIAYQSGMGIFLVVLLGVITGTGGGVIRDILAREVPYVFQKEIYALASIAGGLVFFPLASGNLHLAMYVCFGMTLGIRMTAVWLDLHLPRANSFLPGEKE